MNSKPLQGCCCATGNRRGNRWPCQEGSSALTIGAQVSLWPRLGFRWIDALRAEMPDLGLRAHLNMPNALTRQMTQGVMQISLSCQPTLRPGLSAEKVSRAIRLDNKLGVALVYGF